MSQNKQLEARIFAVLDRLDIRAKSLIVSVYGDMILPQGGSVWLGSLIRLVQPFGLGERVVRTAVFRLTRDGWLSPIPNGRRSDYNLTELGRRQFESAHRRIYAMPGQQWDGIWRLVHATSLTSAEERASLRRELSWQGFGALSPNMFAHPRPDTDLMHQTIQALDLSSKVVVMEAQVEQAQSLFPVRHLVSDCWVIDELSNRYRGFLDQFRLMWQILEKIDEPAAEQCFMIRVLLIHAYRRLLLRDPDLPEELLPAGWPGAATHILCRDIYRRVHAPALEYVMGIVENQNGPLPPPSETYYARFGGLPRS